MIHGAEAYGLLRRFFYWGVRMVDTNNTTAGGASVGRDASAGNDLIGRDRYGSGDGSSSSHVNIHTDQHRGDFTSAEILQNLQKAILGNPYNLGEPGMLKSLAELSASMAAFHAWRTAANVERANLNRDIKHYQDRTNQRLDTTDSRLTAFMVIVWVTVSVVGIELVALIWLFIQHSVSVMNG